jgi:tetratricopeptide (TPR) repeat protein
MKFRNCIGVLSILMVIVLFAVPVAAQDASITDNATQYYNAGVRYLGAGDYTNATLAFNTALTADTTLIEKSDTFQYLYEGKAYALIQLQRYDDALQTSQKGVSLFPQDKILWNNEGYALYSLGQYQNAVNAYNKAITIDGNYTSALNNKGGALYKMGDYTGAVAAYSKANETTPGNAESMDGLKHAQEKAGSVPTVLIVLIAIVIVAAAGAVWYVKFRKPEEKKAAVKKPKSKKNK